MKPNRSNTTQSTTQSLQSKLSGYIKTCFDGKQDCLAQLKSIISDAKNGAEIGYIVDLWFGQESTVEISLMCAAINVLYGYVGRKRKKSKTTDKAQPPTAPPVQKIVNQPNEKKNHDFSESKPQLFALNGITVAIRCHYYPCVGPDHVDFTNVTHVTANKNDDGV